MVQSLVIRLEEEAKAELTHNGKYDKDMAVNAVNIKEFSTKVEKLANEIEVLERNIVKAKQTQTRFSTEITEMKQDLGTANKNRLSEKADNSKTVEELKAAEATLDETMSLLQNYYASSKSGCSSSTFSLIQAHKKQPTFSTGQYEAQGQNGVIGLLEVIKSQISALIRDIMMTEAAAAQSHSELVNETESEIASKTSVLSAFTGDLCGSEERGFDRRGDGWL